ncbi:LysE family translocator [Anaerolentibacter hominis]|uniref:LysE family translocator n=1 Tax=Anaerolentibacter hominis TaxID=3079009 RepID=UPI0031B7FAD3
MTFYFIRGILIGLLFGLPAGAVGAMTVQRTLRYGFKTGLLTGLGSSTADCIYAFIGVFGLTLISDFLLQYQTVIRIAGGSLLLFMGIRILIGKEREGKQMKEEPGGIRMFLSSFAVGITNPAAILTFLFAFSYFGITASASLFQGVVLIIGVFLGTYIWWFILSGLVNIIRKKITVLSFRRLNQVFGIFFSLFGTGVLLQMIL